MTHWEMWNEPDLDFFWDASLEDYAPLLKVEYLAAKHADPSAQVIFGALANNWQRPDYYENVLDEFDGEVLAEDNGYFHDIVATHNYFVAWRSWYYLQRANEAMKAHGLPGKPIWLNESGVPAWDDYPGPVWDRFSPLRATQQEQADFVIQSAFHALSAGAKAISHFQLYDGCGNQPGGTDFPPHNGELCDENRQYNGKPCAGDANGLFRNPTDAVCFTQYPDPESVRSVLTAYQVLTTYNGNGHNFSNCYGDSKCYGNGNFLAHGDANAFAHFDPYDMPYADIYTYCDALAPRNQRNMLRTFVI